MKSIISIGLVLVLASSLVCAATLTEKNAGQASKIIERAVAAHGGTVGLDAIETMIVESERVNFAVDQSRGTEPPWDKNDAHDVSAIDLGKSIFVNHNINNGFAFQADQTTIINGDASFQLDHRAGTAAKIAEPDFATTSGPFVRVTPTLLVRTLEERAANAHYLGEASVEGKDYDVIAFSMSVGPAISLYFDKQDHLLRRSERIFPGIGIVQYEFDDYVVQDGVPMNRTFRFYQTGEKSIDQRNVAMTINDSLDELLTVDANLQTIPEQTPDELARHEIADGVWQVGGNGTYAMFVDMGDYLFAAGGTAGIAERIELLREVVGDKPLRYGMLTHHHFDHVMGVEAYEAEGATVIAAEAHAGIARNAATDGDSLKIETVKKRMMLESGNRELHIIDIGPTAHTEHLLVAYLPVEGILFEADHFTLPQAGPIPPAVRSTRTFAEALAREELAVRKIYTAHSPRGATMEDLEAALQTEVFQASR